MFWGLILEPKRLYTQKKIKKSFHISNAALDIQSSADANKNVQVILKKNDINYVICTLNSKHHLQQHLDLQFEKGDSVTFSLNGDAVVHLVGYLTDDYMMDDENDDEMNLSEGDENDDDSDESVQIEAAKNSKQLKRKKSINKEQQQKKKAKIEMKNKKEEDSEDDESDEEEKSDDDDDEEDSEKEEDGSEDDEESEEEEEKSVKEKKNKKKGVVTNKKEEKQQNGVVAVDKKEKKKKDEKKKDDVKKLKKTIEGGVQIQDLVVGDGPVAKPGKFLQVYYEGRLQSNNKLFDSSKQGNGFKFRLGKKEVIQGWDVGIAGMKVGGKRKIICPPSMAYGSRGSPPVIPPNSWLVFDVELKGVH